MDGRRRQQWQLLMRPWKNKNVSGLFLILISVINVTTSTHEDCPWYQRDEGVADEIKSNCICATNPSSDDQLSIQCQDVHAQTLVSVLLEFEAGTRQPLELLYLNGSRVTDDDGIVPSKLFGGLKITSLQLSGCSIKSVHNEAFTGTEEYLKHLSLAQNEIGSVPTGAFEKLNRLSLLDLGYNKITKIPAKAFHKLIKLATLKLNDNNVELHHEALFGLEGSLRNLNLKGTRISHVPDAVANLSSLAFLDMAQNRLRELNPSHFLKLHSLTALNLERNLLQTLPETVFEGINDTLSSLSLLNNLITNFPQRALKNLRELRVLDLGFNLLTHVDDGAFDGLKSLTLLALDGNPLSTLSEKSFASLNTTLRGISLGGRFLNCDCRITWILEWIQLYDLQVTSRERNPQFCGSPENLRSFTFYQIQPDDLICPKNETVKKAEYDVNLSPEDIALLGMSSVHVSQSASTSVEQSSSNQEMMESNKPTFTLEIPNNNGHKNATIVKYKTRRPRPNPNKYPSKVVFTTSTTNAPVPKNEESVENTAQEISSSEIEPRQGAKNDNKNETSDQEPTASTKQESQQNLIHAANLTTLSTSTTTTTTRKPFVPSSRHPIRNPLPIRPNPVRHRITPKIIPTTTTPTTSTNDETSEDEDEQKELFVISSSTTTIGPLFTHQSSTNNKARKPPALTPQRQPTSSKTIDAVEIDDSKIPVISGIGSAVSSPNLNTGSIMTVKQPSPIQTQNNNARELDNSMHPSMIHQVPHVSRQPPPNLIFADKSEIIVREIVRNENSVMLYWESPRQAAGFRIIYRFFGEDTFRHGPPLAATETEYRIKNIPTNECMVVCVVPYEEILYNEISPSAASVPPGSQCREVKPSSPSALMNHMDKITIGASAAICVTVLIAVLIFIAITKRAKRPPSTLMAKIPPTSYLTPSPGPNMVTSSGGYGMSKEWDQMSVVSTKSIPRARVYHGSMDGLANPPPPLKTATLNPHFYRGGLDGPSPYRSFTSTHHHHHNHNTNNSHGHNYHHNHATNTNSGHTLMHGHGTTATAVNNYLNNQNRLLRTSLGSRASFDALNKLSHTRHSHHQLDHVKRKRSSRLNQSESLNTLNGYETPDNWTDHDMDFYVARNHTRHDLVQL